MSNAGFAIEATDLGIAEPAGLQYCRDNGLPTDYDLDRWTIKDDSGCREELLIIGTTVIWTRDRILQRAFNFSEEKQDVRHALFASFPSSQQSVSQRHSNGYDAAHRGRDTPGSFYGNVFKSTANLRHAQESPVPRSLTEKALVILLDDIAHVYFIDGRRDVFNLPFKVARAISMDIGIVMERLLDIDELPQNLKAKVESIPTIFFLPDPMQELGVVTTTQRSGRLLTSKDKLQDIFDDLLLTTNRSLGELSIWHASYSQSISDNGGATNVKGGHSRRRSSMRASISALKIDGLEEETRSSTAPTDNATNFDRIVFSDVDPYGTFNDASSLRQDHRLNHLNAFPLTSSNESIKAVMITSSATTFMIYIHDTTAHTAMELVYRRVRNSRPILLQQQTLQCNGLLNVTVKNTQHLLLLLIDGTLLLKTHLGPDILVQMDTTCTALLKSYGDNVCYLSSENRMSSFSVEQGFSTHPMEHYWSGLKFVLSAAHYQRLLFLYYDAKRRLHLLTNVELFSVTILACFLQSSQEKRKIAALVDDSHERSVLKLITFAEQLCHIHDFTFIRGFLPQLLLSIHFVMEEQYLDILLWRSRQSAIPLLLQLSQWLRWENYVAYYASQLNTNHALALDDALEYLQIPVPSDGPPVVLDWALSLFFGRKQKLQTIELLVPRDKQMSRDTHSVEDSIPCPRTQGITRIYESLVTPETSNMDLVPLLASIDFGREVIERLPLCLSIPIRDVLQFCSMRPRSNWSSWELSCVGRSDLVDSLTTTEEMLDPKFVDSSFNVLRSRSALRYKTHDVELKAGTISDSLFPHDRRMQEVQRILTCHGVTSVKLLNDELNGEAEQIRIQQDFSKIVAKRTMAIPVGRALLNYNDNYPLPSERFPIPELNYDIKVKPAQVTVSEDKNIAIQSAKAWSQFHNGVAAGLSIARDCPDISASWIAYNKSDDLSNEHAGFLLGLGLNGHLKAMATWHAYNYLTSKHAMTSIGLLLGLSVSFLGSMDPMITKLLSVHVLALLPNSSNELNLSCITQAAGLVGIGALYHASGHQRMSEVLLREISGHDSSSEHFRNEGYRFAAGLALGMVNIGKGASLGGHRSLNILQKLLDCVQGVEREPHDLDVKMPGATIALGLIYLQSENIYVADRLRVPQSRHSLDFVRPDIYLLRVLSLGLIMWSTIAPDMDFIQSLLPADLQGRCTLSGVEVHDTEDLVLFNVVVGACLAIGIRYAGSQDHKARDFLLLYIDRFLRIYSFEAIGVDQKGNVVAIRTLLSVLSYAAAMIMAGSGDLAVLRRLRRLHHNLASHVTYGHHMATETAIGLLFIGGGRFSLQCTNFAVACFIAAFYPILPADPNDNASHLQALRHLWVVAVEKRCIVTREVDSVQACLVPLEITFVPQSRRLPIQVSGPCLLPPLDQIASIEVRSDKYWPTRLDFAQNHEHLKSFQEDQTLFVNRRDLDDTKASIAIPSPTNPEMKSSNMLIAQMISGLLPKTYTGCNPLLQRAMARENPWLTFVFAARSRILRSLSSKSQPQDLREVKFLMAYWHNTTRGSLSEKFRLCSDRVLDENFVQKVGLMIWQSESVGT